MDASIKDIILTYAKLHLEQTCDYIHTQIEKLEPSLIKLEQALKRSSSYDRDIDEQLYLTQLIEKQTLNMLEKSPYFVRCDITFEGKSPETLYFGKASNKELLIYSWVTPVASIRFEQPGSFAFIGNDGNEVKGTISKKDNYMIVDQKLLFLSTEMGLSSTSDVARSKLRTSFRTH